MPEPKKFIVGRKKEIELGNKLLKTQGHIFLLNIYGPGGIGKSVVASKLKDLIATEHIPLAYINGDEGLLTPDKILYKIREQLKTQPDNKLYSLNPFHEFDIKFRDYLAVNGILNSSGGISTLFDLVGNIIESKLLKIVTDSGKVINDTLKNVFKNRFALEKYLKNSNKWLAEALAASIEKFLENSKYFVLLIDTYDKLESIDNWICADLIRVFPKKIKIIILGRNRLSKLNFEWDDLWSENIHYHELDVLEYAESKLYLEHYGLKENKMIDDIIGFTGGYPLCLSLTVSLSKEIGWNQLKGFQNPGDRDRVASQLLERILEEEKVLKLKNFIEIGSILKYFNPEIIAYLLTISIDESELIYRSISKHSFVEPHIYGLKFHDKVRELLEEKFKFTNSGKYKELSDKMYQYYMNKSKNE